MTYRTVAGAASCSPRKQSPEYKHLRVLAVSVSCCFILHLRTLVYSGTRHAFLIPPCSDFFSIRVQLPFVSALTRAQAKETISDSKAAHLGETN